MAKNEQSREVNHPIWFDGKSINEALFCDDFLSRHKIIYTNGAFFTPEGRITDELPLRGEIFEELKCCAVSNIPRKISNIVELIKLAALVEDFPPETDRIHLANGTLFLDGTFTEGKPDIVRCRLPVAYSSQTDRRICINGKDLFLRKFLNQKFYKSCGNRSLSHAPFSGQCDNFCLSAHTFSSFPLNPHCKMICTA